MRFYKELRRETNLNFSLFAIDISPSPLYIVIRALREHKMCGNYAERTFIS
jgi:hypothetical protein